MDRKKQRNEESDKFDIPVAVLDDVFYEKVELGVAFVSNVVQKTEISRLVRDLCSIFPLSNWAHLKRVKSQGDKDKQIQVIICQVNDLEGCPNPSLSALTERHGIETRGLEGLYTVQVPHKPPLTRSQYEEASIYWPVHFHEDKRISRLLNGTEIFTQKELAHIHSHMETAVKMAEIALQKQQLPVGAVIVDGRTNTVVAKSHDYRHGSSPLHHAAMTCVDLVARGQGGGAWDWSHDIDFYSARIAGAQHDSREVIVTSKSEQEISSHRPAEENRKNSQGEATMSDQIVEESAGNQSEDAYLCTGYDLYTTREPCAMCAMSLVHSRIRRVFYGASHQNGALGTRYKLHAQKGLNHHYEVFRGVREEQCAKLLINT